VPLKAIVFDCWNTLFYHSAQSHPFESFANEIGFSMHNPRFSRLFEKHFMTENFSDFEEPTRNLLNDVGINPNEDLKDRLGFTLKRLNESNKMAFPEVLETLEKLRSKFKLVLLTNTTGKSFEILNKKYNVSALFDVVIKSCDVGLLKPNFDFFELVLKKTGLQKDEIVLVGDNLENDVQAAEEFGFKSILVDRKMKYWDNENSIQSLSELESKLERL